MNVVVGFGEGKKKKRAKNLRLDSFFAFVRPLPLRFFSVFLRSSPAKMDSGASFSEPKISMEPLKAVQVREEKEEVLRFLWPSHRHPEPAMGNDRNLSGLLSAFSKHERSCSLADREQRVVLSRKGRRKRAGVQYTTEKEEGERMKKEERSVAAAAAAGPFSHLVFFSHPSPSCLPLPSLPSRDGRNCHALQLEMDRGERERARKGLIEARETWNEATPSLFTSSTSSSTSSLSRPPPSFSRAFFLSFAHKQTTSIKKKLRHTTQQARQAAVQAAQKAIGFSYLLGKSDRVVSVALPTALVAFSFVAIAKGAMQMYTQPGKNS